MNIITFTCFFLTKFRLFKTQLHSSSHYISIRQYCFRTFYKQLKLVFRLLIWTPIESKALREGDFRDHPVHSQPGEMQAEGYLQCCALVPDRDWNLVFVTACCFGLWGYLALGLQQTAELQITETCIKSELKKMLLKSKLRGIHCRWCPRPL